MVDVKRWLRQTVLYEEPGETNAFGDTTPGESYQVPARYEQKQELVRTKTGEERISEARVLLEIEPDLSAKIEGRPIQTRESLVDVKGNVVGWRAFL